VEPEPARRGVELVQEAAADDEELAGGVLGGDLAQEPAEIGLERPVVERPREPARARVVREVVARIGRGGRGGRGHRGGSPGGSPASATIRYSYAVGESAATSGSRTAQRTSRAGAASSASGNRRASRAG